MRAKKRVERNVFSVGGRCSSHPTALLNKERRIDQCKLSVNKQNMQAACLLFYDGIRFKKEII